jgi:hypothetical protein
VGLAGALDEERSRGIVVRLVCLWVVWLLVLLHMGVGDVVWIAVYRGSGGSRGDRVSFVVGIAIGGKGVVEVCLCGRGGIAVVVVMVVVEAGVGVAVGVDVEVVLAERVVVVVGINVKDGRGRGA